MDKIYQHCHANRQHRDDHVPSRRHQLPSAATVPLRLVRLYLAAVVFSLAVMSTYRFFRTLERLSERRGGRSAFRTNVIVTMILTIQWVLILAVFPGMILRRFQYLVACIFPHLLITASANVMLIVALLRYESSASLRTFYNVVVFMLDTDQAGDDRVFGSRRAENQQHRQMLCILLGYHLMNIIFALANALIAMLYFVLVGAAGCSASHSRMKRSRGKHVYVELNQLVNEGTQPLLGDGGKGEEQQKQQQSKVNSLDNLDEFV